MSHSEPILSNDPGDDPGSDPAEPRAFTVTAGQHGERLDRVLAQIVPEFSRSYLQQLIANGAVRLRGEATASTKSSSRLQAGDTGVIELQAPPQAQAFRPEPIALDTVYADAHVRVLNKPAGMVVHPAAGNWSGTLLNGLLADDPAAAALPRAGIVHRLDKDTSGLMVVARSRAAMDALVRAIAAHEVRRNYLALAHRHWSGPAERQIDAPIGRDPRNRLRMAVVDPARTPGKTARTDVKLLQQATAAPGCWLECALHTGRTHQIRVHLASIGHPLVADATYGGAAAGGLERQALHAVRLGFLHPVTAQPLLFEAPLPADLLGGLSAWGISVISGG